MSNPNQPEPSRRAPSGPSTKRLRVAVLGDSDSHIYRDPCHGLRRGGEHHAVTLQWTEVWDRLRHYEVDLGRLGIWGSQRGKIASARSLLRLDARVPRKRDFEFNYAVIGAGSAGLNDDWPYQTRWLCERMQREGEEWASGLVIVRIGVNDFGQPEHLRRWALSGSADEARAIVDASAAGIRRAVNRVIATTPSVRVGVVGIARDYNLREFDSVLEGAELRRIDTILGRFDAALREFAATRANVAFIDDLKWFEDRLGHRSRGTLKDEFQLGGGTTIVRGNGDHPRHITLADGHAGTVNNALWLSSLIEQLNMQLGLGLTPIRDAEIAALVDPDGRLGIAPGR